MKEKRERKRAKKAEAAAARAAGEEAPQPLDGSGDEDALAPTAPESTPPPHE